MFSTEPMRSSIRGSVQHVQEALGVAQALLRRRRPATRLTVVRRRRKGGRLPEDPHDLLV